MALQDLAPAAGFHAKETWFSHLAPGPETDSSKPQLLGPKGGADTGFNLQLPCLALNLGFASVLTLGPSSYHPLPSQKTPIFLFLFYFIL